MTIEDVTLALAEVASGDLRQLDALAVIPQSDIEQARCQLGVMQLNRSGLRRVITALREGKVTISSAQRWASFVSRGYFGGNNGRVQPIQIAYDIDAEGLIADTVSRLDELGDQVDGKIDDLELANMLQLLH